MNAGHLSRQLSFFPSDNTEQYIAAGSDSDELDLTPAAGRAIAEKSYAEGNGAVCEYPQKRKSPLRKGFSSLKGQVGKLEFLFLLPCHYIFFFSGSLI